MNWGQRKALMRQGPNSRRARGRNNNVAGGRRHNVPNRNQTFDSNGPDVRIRGNAYQVYEKYQALARDATASGDRVTAENYLQHAEHYFRIINEVNEAFAQSQPSEATGRENGHARGGFDARDGQGRDNGSQPNGQHPGRPDQHARPEQGNGHDRGTSFQAGENEGRRQGKAAPDQGSGPDRAADFGTDPRTEDDHDGPNAGLPDGESRRAGRQDELGRPDGEADEERSSEPRPPRRRRSGVARARRSAANGPDEAVPSEASTDADGE